ncbi:hypothetical protein KP509_15G028800 [Ceratopteris richardii]|uniref:FCP1 homology domain-containing protein n=1 Tax=Ceratopteris richardii TaxID=49495 RepID=A0A8T2T213_CERRI|nr:hypothetical protein KP509_15G028800 [Ceratopteris richardii]
MDAIVDPCPIDNMHDVDSTHIDFHSGLDRMIENVLDPVSSSDIHLASHNPVVDNDPLVCSNKDVLQMNATNETSSKQNYCNPGSDSDMCGPPIKAIGVHVQEDATLMQFMENAKRNLQIQHGLREEEIQELKHIHKNLQPRALILEAFPDSNAFLQWCLEHFNVWIWSAYDLDEVNKCIDTIFPMFRRKFMDIWGRDQCFWSFSIHFKKLDHFWDKNVEYRPDNTLIINTISYRLFYNIRRCCLMLPKMTISERLNYLLGTLCDQLWKWLIAPNCIEYVDIISRLIPLDEESLSIYHGIHQDQNRDYMHNRDYTHNRDCRQKHLVMPTLGWL